MSREKLSLDVGEWVESYYKNLNYSAGDKVFLIKVENGMTHIYLPDTIEIEIDKNFSFGEEENEESNDRLKKLLIRVVLKKDDYRKSYQKIFPINEGYITDEYFYYSRVFDTIFSGIFYDVSRYVSQYTKDFIEKLVEGNEREKQYICKIIVEEEDRILERLEEQEALLRETIWERNVVWMK